MRIGQGYDLHRLVENRNLILGGVKIPHCKGLLGHSDADVLLHAIIDALFGATGCHDIGYHFPDTDIKYRGANSLLLLKESSKIIKEKGFKIINIDSTIVCQKPKLADYINDMKKNISYALEIDENLISIKAKTNEGVDATGKEEAIQAYSAILVENPIG